MEGRNAPFYYNEDRISKLPDTLIHHIFSFLDMKYAVLSSILSRRWRYFWASLPILNFNSSLLNLPGAKQVDSFLDFIDRVFVLRNSTDIQRFHLVYHDMDCDETIPRSLNSWILAAVRRNVQELFVDIDVSISFIVKLPPCLFTCKSLTKFELEMSRNGYSDFVLPNSISLPCLKSLKLTSLSTIDEELTDKLFSSCPVLESLIITDSRMNLNISSPSLKHFELKNGQFRTLGGGVKIARLNAPNLTSFSCQCYMGHDNSLENLSSLVSADIKTVEENDNDKVSETSAELPAGVKQLHAENTMKLIRALQYVEDLTLSPRFLKAVSGAVGLLDIQPPQFLNLRNLKLQMWLTKDSFHALTYLLKIFPIIESLSLVMITKNCLTEPPVDPFSDEIKFSSANIGDYWQAGLWLPCMLHHLKYVEILGVVGCVSELNFLEFILKNAMVLEKVVIFTSLQGLGDMEERMIEFRKKLLTFPKASSSVVISASKS